jgi:cytochrome P450
MRTAKRVSVFDAGLPTIAYHGVTDPDEAHRVIADASRQGPLALGPYGPEVLTYEMMRSVLRDPRFGIHEAIALAVQGITSGSLWHRVSRLMVSVDGAAHLRLRRLVSQAFTPSAAERLRSACGAIMAGLLDGVMAAGRCDVVADLARPYPVPIICRMLGVPREDWPLFSEYLRAISKAFGITAARHSSDILIAWRSLDDYLEDLLARKRRSRCSDDLLSDLARAEDGGDRLTHREILDLVAVLLLAGTDNTRNQLAAAVQVLADHPEQWALLARRPDLARGAAEEAVRYMPTSFNAARIATTDVELGGVLIPAGTSVVLNAAAANRDPAQYPDPDRFDILRSQAPSTLTFGGGAHHCLGIHVARVELAEALVVMSRRMPSIRRTGPAPWRPIVGITGPKTLPIEFDLDPPLAPTA